MNKQNLSSIYKETKKAYQKLIKTSKHLNLNKIQKEFFEPLESMAGTYYKKRILPENEPLGGVKLDQPLRHEMQHYVDCYVRLLHLFDQWPHDADYNYFADSVEDQQIIQHLKKIKHHHPRQQTLLNLQEILHQRTPLDITKTYLQFTPQECKSFKSSFLALLSDEVSGKKDKKTKNSPRSSPKQWMVQDLYALQPEPLWTKSFEQNLVEQSHPIVHSLPPLTAEFNRWFVPDQAELFTTEEILRSNSALVVIPKLPEHEGIQQTHNISSQDLSLIQQNETIPQTLVHASTLHPQAFVEVHEPSHTLTSPRIHSFDSAVGDPLNMQDYSPIHSQMMKPTIPPIHSWTSETKEHQKTFDINKTTSHYHTFLDAYDRLHLSFARQFETNLQSEAQYKRIENRYSPNAGDIASQIDDEDLEGLREYLSAFIRLIEDLKSDPHDIIRDPSCPMELRFIWSYLKWAHPPLEELAFYRYVTDTDHFQTMVDRAALRESFFSWTIEKSVMEWIKIKRKTIEHHFQQYDVSLFFNQNYPWLGHHRDIATLHRAGLDGGLSDAIYKAIQPYVKTYGRSESDLQELNDQAVQVWIETWTRYPIWHYYDFDTSVQTIQSCAMDGMDQLIQCWAHRHSVDYDRTTNPIYQAIKGVVSNRMMCCQTKLMMDHWGQSLTELGRHHFIVQGSDPELCTYQWYGKDKDTYIDYKTLSQLPVDHRYQIQGYPDLCHIKALSNQAHCVPWDISFLSLQPLVPHLPQAEFCALVVVDTEPDGFTLGLASTPPILPEAETATPLGGMALDWETVINPGLAIFIPEKPTHHQKITNHWGMYAVIRDIEHEKLFLTPMTYLRSTVQWES